MYCITIRAIQLLNTAVTARSQKSLQFMVINMNSTFSDIKYTKFSFCKLICGVW